MKTFYRIAAGILLALLSLPLDAAADNVLSEERKVTQLAEGVYTIRHKDPLPGWVNGNTTVIIGEREVLVMDSCQMPYTAQEDIAQIRQWTNKPVRYLVNSHWHQDHNGANKDYLDAFPGLAILAHPMTSLMMENTGPTVGPEMLKQATEVHDRLTKRLETGKLEDGQPLSDERRATSTARLAQVEQVIAAAKTFAYQLPTLTFERELTIDLGRREVRVMHLGRGNTAGDVVVYLPKEKILMTGDLVVSPVPYMFDGYPVQWIETLEKLDGMDAAVIVPGHGDVMRDKAYLRMLIEMMKAIVEQVHAQLRLNNDMPVADVMKAIDLKAFRDKFAGGDKTAEGFFDLSVGDKFVELAYYEEKQR